MTVRARVQAFEIGDKQPDPELYVDTCSMTGKTDLPGNTARHPSLPQITLPTALDSITTPHYGGGVSSRASTNDWSSWDSRSQRSDFAHERSEACHDPPCNMYLPRVSAVSATEVRHPEHLRKELTEGAARPRRNRSTDGRGSLSSSGAGGLNRGQGQLPPNANKHQLPPAEQASAGQVPGLLTSAGQVPDMLTSAGQVPDMLTSTGQVPRQLVSAGQVPRQPLSAGHVPHQLDSAGKVPSKAARQRVSAGQVPRKAPRHQLVSAGPAPQRQLVSAAGQAPQRQLVSAAGQVPQRQLVSAGQVPCVSQAEEEVCAEMQRELETIQARLVRAEQLLHGLTADSVDPNKTVTVQLLAPPKNGARVTGGLGRLGAVARDLAMSKVARASARGAVVGAATCGTVGASSGMVVGSTCGAVMGLVPAFFTLGLSIPIGAALGGYAGLCTGGVVGSTAGAFGGGVAGFVKEKSCSNQESSLSEAVLMSTTRCIQDDAPDTGLTRSRSSSGGTETSLDRQLVALPVTIYGISDDCGLEYQDSTTEICDGSNGKVNRQSEAESSAEIYAALGILGHNRT